MFTSKELGSLFVGYDKVVERFSKLAEDSIKMAGNIKYPPFNYKKVGDNKYVIEMAVAGFGKQDLDIELSGDTLVIKGNAQLGDEANEDGEYPQYFYQGLAKRPFTRQFTLGDSVEIKNAQLINGILRVFLEAVAPENKPTKIEIADAE